MATWNEKSWRLHVISSSSTRILPGRCDLHNLLLDNDSDEHFLIKANGNTFLLFLSRVECEGSVWDLAKAEYHCTHFFQSPQASCVFLFSANKQSIGQESFFPGERSTTLVSLLKAEIPTVESIELKKPKRSFSGFFKQLKILNPYLSSACTPSLSKLPSSTSSLSLPPASPPAAPPPTPEPATMSKTVPPTRRTKSNLMVPPGQARSSVTPHRRPPLPHRHRQRAAYASIGSSSLPGIPQGVPPLGPVLYSGAA
ncbi:MAG: hypothetical protein Q9227_007284 [Pyrenula ochraceoflavens]